MYALNLDENNRILSVTFDEYAPENQPKVENIPNGDVYEYLYVDGEYIYDPLPEPEPIPEPESELTDEEMATAILKGVNEV